MNDLITMIIQDTHIRIRDGYYKTAIQDETYSSRSLLDAIKKCKVTPIIAEFKPHSPLKGPLSEKLKLDSYVKAVHNAGAVGISVLTEPTYFNGQLAYLKRTRDMVPIPLLMKDFIINPMQIEAAKGTGADVILLIKMLFDEGCCNLSLNEMIDLAHTHKLEVLLETHSEREFRDAIETEADLIGINNRNLNTMKVDVGLTKKILEKTQDHNHPVVSESGIESPQQIDSLKHFGVNAFLIGTSIMKAPDIESKVKELVEA